MNIVCPEKGDIVLVNLSSVMGDEQKGSRSALVLTDKKFNNRTGICWLVPITSVEKNYPFEVKVRAEKTFGIVLANQVRSIDFKARKVKKIDKISKKSLAEVLELIKLILG